MDRWKSDLMDLLGNMSREDRETIGYIIEMADKDYENHLKKEKKNES